MSKKRPTTYIITFIVLCIIVCIFVKELHGNDKKHTLLESTNTNITGNIKNENLGLSVMLDSSSDNSITKYVSAGHPFTFTGYVPTLTGVVASENIKLINTKGDGHYIRPEAYQSLQAMAQQFYNDTGKPLVIYSSYRSYQYQKNNISQLCKNSGYCAKEGESEHQLGLAIDFRGTDDDFTTQYSTEYEWLKNNAHLYGRHQSYQKGKEIDGYNPEPRHRRYLGIELATYLHENNMTFTELYTTTTHGLLQTDHTISPPTQIK